MYAQYASQVVNSGLWVMSMPSFRNWRPISYTRSMPPTTSCFRYSSGAMRMYSCMFRSLWNVMNGLAVAPPGIMFIMGVSTSR